MASFYTTAVFGILLPPNFSKERVPNPAYDPEAPFNPKTGQPVPPYLDRDIGIAAVIQELGLEEVHTTDNAEVVVGIAAPSMIIGEGGSSEISVLDPNKMMVGNAKVIEFCRRFGLNPAMIAIHAVGYCSY